MKHTSILFTMLLGAATHAFAQDNQHAQHAQHGQHADHAQHGQGQGANPAVSHVMASSPGAEKAPYDAQFLDSMSAHHQGGVDMAKLVPERAQHSELKDKAREMIDKQAKEIHQLQTWKQEWYPNVKPAVNLRLPGMKAMDHKQLDKLTASRGHAFDLQFLDMMIKHHQGGIAMAQDALKRASHAQVKEQAKKIIDDQKKEQAELKKWHKEWSAGHH